MLPKVLLHRNSEGQLIQLDNQSPQQTTIQYSYMPQLDQNQQQQHLIIQQQQQPQIKQTIYPGQNQVSFEIIS